MDDLRNRLEGPLDEDPATDPTGCLAEIEGLLAEQRPALLFLSTGEGKVKAARGGAEIPARRAGELARELIPALDPMGFCAVRKEFRGQPYWLFGLRLPAVGEVLGGLMDAAAVAEPCMEVLAPLLTACGRWASSEIRGHNTILELKSRIHRLTAEHTLIDRTALVEAEGKAERLQELVARLTNSLEKSRTNGRTRPEAETALSAREVAACRSGRDRRTSTRSAFHCMQRIAPMRDGCPPEPADFFEVECTDISAGGFSFLWDRQPEFDTLAVVLGKPPQEVALAARIVRVTSKGSLGKVRRRIGCRFLSRLSLRDLLPGAETADAARGLSLGGMEPSPSS